MNREIVALLEALSKEEARLEEQAEEINEKNHVIAQAYGIIEKLVASPANDLIAGELEALENTIKMWKWIADKYKGDETFYQAWELKAEAGRALGFNTTTLSHHCHLCEFYEYRSFSRMCPLAKEKYILEGVVSNDCGLGCTQDKFGYDDHGTGDQLSKFYENMLPYVQRRIKAIRKGLEWYENENRSR